MRRISAQSARWELNALARPSVAQRLLAASQIYGKVSVGSAGTTLAAQDAGVT